jgi:predicted phosphate transport protein (TIGR00153 family)
MGFKDLFQSKDAQFLQLLVDQSAKTLEGIEELQRFVESGNRDAAKRVKQLEREADELRRIVTHELDQTFITPIDPEDIYQLSRTIDEILDYADSTVEEMELFGIRGNDTLRQMVGLVLEGAQEIHFAMVRLKDHPSVAGEHASRARSLENRVEKVYRRAVADLFNTMHDVPKVVEGLKYREVYRHLSNAADRYVEAADVVAHIVVKVT